jgi:hypothetical protein
VPDEISSSTGKKNRWNASAPRAIKNTLYLARNCKRQKKSLPLSVVFFSLLSFLPFLLFFFLA